MSIAIKIALAVAVVLGAAVSASAATKTHKSAGYQNGPQARATVSGPAAFSNSDSPEATGGGSLGYNEMHGW